MLKWWKMFAPNCTGGLLVWSSFFYKDEQLGCLDKQRLRLLHKCSTEKEKMKKVDVCIMLYNNFQLSAVIHLTSLWFEIEGSRCYSHSLDFSSV